MCAETRAEILLLKRLKEPNKDNYTQLVENSIHLKRR